MRCLWIGRDCTYPADSGDAIYSSRLLESFRDAGAEVTVLCRRRPGGSTVLPDGIEFRQVETKVRREIGSLLTRSPNIGHRHNTTSMREALAEELDREWDAILLDHIGAAWALPQLRGHLVREPGIALVYLSQNHEASTRRLVATNAPGNPVSRLVLRYDAWKAGLLEGAIVDAAALITVVTDDDGAVFAAESPSTPVLTLSPGYSDHVRSSRTITADLPRRAVVVGSFDWIAKRMNLEELVAVADARFAAASAELLVVGRGPDDWLAHMRASATATRFTGFVESVIEHLDEARIGIVAERSGGGFKLKALHYVFNRVPVAAVAGSLSGIPLVAGDSKIEAANVEALVDHVLALLDDVDALNELQRRAFDACAGQFEWSARGRALFDALSERRRSGAAGHPGR